jgi:hypothetical protein
MLNDKESTQIIEELDVSRSMIRSAQVIVKFGRRIDALDQLTEAFAGVAKAIEMLRVAEDLTYSQIFNRSHSFHKLIPLWLAVLKLEREKKQRENT